MKVLFPVEVFYPSQAGGASNSVYWIAKFLAAHGFEPTVIASAKGLGRDFLPNRWNENEAGRVLHVRTAFLKFPIGQTLRSLMQVRRTDVVHLSSIFYPAAFVTALAARVLEKKTVWSVRGELDPLALANHAQRRKSWVLRAIRSAVGAHPLFHSTCEEETGYIRDVFGPHVRIIQIPNFIELPAVVARSPESYILYLGRIHPKKGIDNLLTAISLTPEFMRSGYILKIAGTGARHYERALRRLVSALHLEKHVEFVGQVEGEQKQHLLANAYWTFMPSHTENFGLVVLESLAQHTPVAASIGSPWQVLERERLGFWSGNSPHDLSVVLKRILSLEPEEYEAMRSRARAFVESNFDMSKNIAKWIDTYRAL